MSTPPSSSSRDADNRLLRCFRDLAALNALPSMCVGRSPEEALELVLDALPTALTCDLIYLELPGSPAEQRASLAGVQVPASELPALRAALDGECDARGALEVPGLGPRFCLHFELPIGRARGGLIAGRRTPLDPATDRVLIRSAANLVGTTLETAHVLDAARRKDEFIAMLGHELRNPLAPILTAVELRARNPSAAREQRVIERHTRHLARLVDDLLDISRATRGHIELRSEEIARSIDAWRPCTEPQRYSVRLREATSRGAMVRARRRSSRRKSEEEGRARACHTPTSDRHGVCRFAGELRRGLSEANAVDGWKVVGHGAPMIAAVFAHV